MHTDEQNRDPHYSYTVLTLWEGCTKFIVSERKNKCMILKRTGLLAFPD